MQSNYSTAFLVRLAVKHGHSGMRITHKRGWHFTCACGRTARGGTTRGSAESAAAHHLRQMGLALVTAGKMT